MFCVSCGDLGSEVVCGRRHSGQAGGEPRDGAGGEWFDCDLEWRGGPGGAKAREVHSGQVTLSLAGNWE